MEKLKRHEAIKKFMTDYNITNKYLSENSAVKKIMLDYGDIDIHSEYKFKMTTFLNIFFYKNTLEARPDKTNEAANEIIQNLNYSDEAVKEVISKKIQSSFVLKNLPVEIIENISKEVIEKFRSEYFSKNHIELSKYIKEWKLRYSTEIIRKLLETDAYNPTPETWEKFTIALREIAFTLPVNKDLMADIKKDSSDLYLKYVDLFETIDSTESFYLKNFYEQISSIDDMTFFILDIYSELIEDYKKKFTDRLDNIYDKIQNVTCSQDVLADIKNYFNLIKLSENDIKKLKKDEDAKIPQRKDDPKNKIEKHYTDILRKLIAKSSPKCTEFMKRLKFFANLKKSDWEIILKLRFIFLDEKSKIEFWNFIIENIFKDKQAFKDPAKIDWFYGDIINDYLP